MRVTVILNPVSGAHADRPQRLRSQIDHAVATLERERIDVAVRATEHAGHATALALDAVQAGADVVAAWGGDGTVNEVAAALADSAATLAILPAGSGSGLARALGIPLRFSDALQVIPRGRTIAIDLGRVRDERAEETGAVPRLFANVAGLGLDATIALAFNADRRARPGRRGLGTYVRLTLRELRRFTPLQCRVRAGDDTIEAHALLVAMANSPQYGNGARIAPDAQIDDGLVDVVVVEATSWARDVWRARRLFDGSIARDPATHVRRASTVTVESETPLTYHTDGEAFLGGTRLEVTMRPKALRVRVP